jgi:gamma-glutamylcyclotransferase (GGCT)/AIG2-like uncharacterized protein YtfP
MNWMNTSGEFGHLNEAMIHFNESIEADAEGASRVAIAGYLSNTLNKIQTEWLLRENQQAMGQVRSFQTMIANAVASDDQTEFLLSGEVKNLVYLEPRIMNHNTLTQHRYRPGVEIEPDLVAKASEEHKRVCTAYDEFLSQASDETRQRVLKRVAELLYVVRSNIAHGEKTPYGPDLNKWERDESVCRVVVPLQKLLVNLLLDKPDQKLVVYGTLAPGQLNYSVLEDLQGTFEKCIVHGRIDESNQLLFFAWQIEGPAIDAQLLTSPKLRSRWVDLDRFEGNAYKRQLVPVEKNSGISVANIYVLAGNPEEQRWEH